LSDIVHDESREAARGFKALPHTIPANRRVVAERVSTELVLDEYFAQVLPDRKAPKVKAVQSCGYEVWATGLNVVAISLAALLLFHHSVLLNPAVGAILMSLSTITVAMNAHSLGIRDTRVRLVRWRQRRGFDKRQQMVVDSRQGPDTTDGISVGQACSAVRSR
jgi:hypothetical protein